jgi:hypothetical protein
MPPSVDRRLFDLQSRIGPLSPCRPSDPFDPQRPWGPLSSFWPYVINPLEQRMADVLNQKQKGYPNLSASAQIPPELRMQLANPPKVEPVRRPGVAPARHEPPAAPSWQLWGWVAAGILVLSLLAYLLRDHVERKHTGR